MLSTYINIFKYIPCPKRTSSSVSPPHTHSNPSTPLPCLMYVVSAAPRPEECVRPVSAALV
ncbi:hypothetical protein EON63_15880 [archaeon]|nr:MAG: hypothetical protein EON63_15880 [archaeon]